MLSPVRHQGRSAVRLVFEQYAPQPASSARMRSPPRRKRRWRRAAVRHGDTLLDAFGPSAFCAAPVASRAAAGPREAPSAGPPASSGAPAAQIARRPSLSGLIAPASSWSVRQGKWRIEIGLRARSRHRPPAAASAFAKPLDETASRGKVSARASSRKRSSVCPRPGRNLSLVQSRGGGRDNARSAAARRRIALGPERLIEQFTHGGGYCRAELSDILAPASVSIPFMHPITGRTRRPSCGGMCFARSSFS